MTAFLTDSFTGSAGVSITSHTGDVGAAWVKHPVNASGTAVLSNANRLRSNAGGVQGNAFYSSGVPGKLVFRTAGNADAPGTATATLTLSATAFGAASSGTATAAAITSDTNAAGNASAVATATLEDAVRTFDTENIAVRDCSVLEMEC